MASVQPPPKFIPPPPKRTIAERIAEAIESVGLYASRKIFIDAQLVDRGGIPRIKFKDALVPVMYADRDGFLQPLGWEGWTAQMDVVFQQQNAAGGAMVIDISPGVGSEFQIIGGTAISVTAANTLRAAVRQAGTTTDTWRLTALASAANNAIRFPTASGGANTNDAPGWPPYPVIVSGGSTLTFYQTAAGAQNDTIEILIFVRLKHKNQLPSVSIANSTNPGNVVVTSGSTTFSVVE